MAEQQFTIKNEPPNEVRIKEILKDKYLVLEDIRKFIRDNIGVTIEEWKYYGVKNGWVLKTFLKKRNLFFIGIYDICFRISFVFGDKAVQSVLESDISEELKKTLSEARKYAEGRGLSIEVFDSKNLEDIQKLIKIKVE